MGWNNAQAIGNTKFICGHCGNLVASTTGFQQANGPGSIFICPHCDKPIFFGEDKRIPDALPGNEVEHLPADIANLYHETRACVGASCYTSAVLTSRKLLMNIGVSQGAKEGKSFIEYIEFLADAGFVPPNGKGWVDHIRKKGNEANHEIKLMSSDDAKELIAFLEMLLKFIYEFPSKIPVAAVGN